MKLTAQDIHSGRPTARTSDFFCWKIKESSARRRSVQVLCDAPEGRGSSWSQRGVIIFTPNLFEPLYKVAEGGGTPEKITETKPGWTHRNPYFMPDGDHFLFVSRQASGGRGSVGGVYALPLSGIWSSMDFADKIVRWDFRCLSGLCDLRTKCRGEHFESWKTRTEPKSIHQKAIRKMPCSSMIPAMAVSPSAPAREEPLESAQGPTRVIAFLRWRPARNAQRRQSRRSPREVTRMACYVVANVRLLRA
jgi:hypothetical protein